MRGKMKLFKYGQKGFTLVEVLVVIAILGALAGVVILSVIQFIGRGACEAAATEKHNIQIAAIAYSYETGLKSSVPVGPGKGDLAPYLLTDPRGVWTLVDGIVTAGVYPGCDDL
jgi:prepilin-type N-terminal cleavage/methylation domain-containing protein